MHKRYFTLSIIDDKMVQILSLIMNNAVFNYCQKLRIDTQAWIQQLDPKVMVQPRIQAPFSINHDVIIKFLNTHWIGRSSNYFWGLLNSFLNYNYIGSCLFGWHSEENAWKFSLFKWSFIEIVWKSCFTFELLILISNIKNFNLGL